MEKITFERIDATISTLKQIQCNDDTLSAADKESITQSVLILSKLMKYYVPVGQKKERLVDPRFPRAGSPWTEHDVAILSSALIELTDIQIDENVMQLAIQHGRTPFSIALKIVSLGRLDEAWAEKFRHRAKDIEVTLAATS